MFKRTNQRREQSRLSFTHQSRPGNQFNFVHSHTVDCLMNENGKQPKVIQKYVDEIRRLAAWICADFSFNRTLKMWLFCSLKITKQDQVFWWYCCCSLSISPLEASKNDRPLNEQIWSTKAALLMMESIKNPLTRINRFRYRKLSDHYKTWRWSSSGCRPSGAFTVQCL